MKNNVIILIFIFILIILFYLKNTKIYNSYFEKFTEYIEEYITPSINNTNNSMNNTGTTSMNNNIDTTSINNTPSINSKNINDNDISVKFTLNQSYDDTGGENYIENLHNELCKLLQISKYRISNINIGRGSVLVQFTIKKQNENENKNDLMNSIDLYNLFKNNIKNLSNDNMLYNIDPNTVTIDKSFINTIDLNPIIPKNLNFLEKIIINKLPFKMYTIISKKGIYPDISVSDDPTPIKLYLKVNNRNNKLDSCNDIDGLLELCEESEVSKNCVFKLSTIIKNFNKEDKPFKVFEDFVLLLLLSLLSSFNLFVNVSITIMRRYWSI
jgi:hypothetical protein